MFLYFIRVKNGPVFVAFIPNRYVVLQVGFVADITKKNSQ